MTQRWVATYDQRAEDDLALLLSDPRIEARFWRLMDLLVCEEDPRRPSRKILDVAHLEHVGKNWFRLKDKQYRFRVAFELKYRNGKQVLVYKYDEALLPGAEQAINITWAGKRDPKTYERIRKRFKEIYG